MSSLYGDFKRRYKRRARTHTLTRYSELYSAGKKRTESNSECKFRGFPSSCAPPSPGPPSPQLFHPLVPLLPFTSHLRVPLPPLVLPNPPTPSRFVSPSIPLDTNEIYRFGHECSLWKPRFPFLPSFPPRRSCLVLSYLHPRPPAFFNFTSPTPFPPPPDLSSSLPTILRPAQFLPIVP